MTKLMTLEESRALERSPHTSHAYWRAALAGEIMRTSPDYVPLGWFRKSKRDGTSLPVSIYLEAGVKKVQTGKYTPEELTTDALEAAYGRNVFANFAGKAITYEVYLHWFQTGEWPAAQGTDAVIEASLKPKPRAPKAAPKAEPKAEPAPKTEPAPQASNQPPAGIGHNSGLDATIAFETFVDQISAALKGVDGAKAVDSDEKAGAAQSLRSRLSELAKEGDTKRAAEKEPHLVAGRAVDDKWNPRIKEARDAATVLRKGIEAHETAKLRAERERKAREAAEVEAAAAATKVSVTSAPDPAPSPSLVQPEQKQSRIAGAYGRATSAKTRLEVDTIDFRMVCDQLVDSNDELKALLKKLAQRAVDIGATLRGVTTKEVARIR